MNGANVIEFRHTEHAEVVLLSMLDNAENKTRAQLIDAAQAARAVGLGVTPEIREAARQAQDRLNVARLHSENLEQKANFICIQAAVFRVIEILSVIDRIAA